MSDLDLQLRRENAHRLIRPLLHRREASMRVLDVGCGTGDVLDGLPRGAISVIGLDSVTEMVLVASGKHPSDQFVVGDATRLPLREGSVDLVSCLGVLEYLRTPETALGSFRDSLRPGGHLVLSLPNRSSVLRTASRLEIALEEGVIRTVRWLSGGSRQSARDPGYAHRQWTPAEACRLVEVAGFVVEEMLFNTYGLWGRVGRWRPSLALSAWLSRTPHRRSRFSTFLACTMVMRARRPSRG